MSMKTFNGAVAAGVLFLLQGCGDADVHIVGGENSAVEEPTVDFPLIVSDQSVEHFVDAPDHLQGIYQVAYQAGPKAEAFVCDDNSKVQHVTYQNAPEPTTTSDAENFGIRIDLGYGNNGYGDNNSWATYDGFGKEGCGIIASDHAVTHVVGADGVDNMVIFSPYQNGSYTGFGAGTACLPGSRKDYALSKSENNKFGSALVATNNFNGMAEYIVANAKPESPEGMYLAFTDEDCGKGYPLKFITQDI